MFTYEVSLGNLSNLVDSIFLPGIKLPNIIILSQTNAIIIWNIKSDSCVATLKKSSKIFSKIIILRAIKYKQNNNIFIACGFDRGIIQIWKMNIFKSTINCTLLKGHEVFLNNLIFCPRKFILASGCNNGNIILWNIVKKIGIFRIKFAHIGKINSICFIGKIKPYFNFILSCGFDNFLKFWKIETGSCFKIINLPFSNIFSIRFLRRKNLLIFSIDGRKIPIYQIKRCLVFSHIGSLWKTIKIQETKLNFDHEESILTIYGREKTIEIFMVRKDLPSKFKIKKNLKISDIFLNSFTFSFNSKILSVDFWSSKRDKNMIVFVHFFCHTIELYKIILFDSNKNLKKENISLLKIYKAKIECNHSDIREIIWFSNDFFLAALCGTAKKINIWYINTQKCKQILRLRSPGLSMILCGIKTILIGDKEGNLEMFDIFSGELFFSKTKAHIGPIWALDLMKNFFFLASAGSDGIVKIWEIESSELLLNKFFQYGEQILGLKLISKKNLIIINAISSKLTAFFIDTLQFSFSLYGHNLPIMALTVRDDEFFIASGSADFSIRIWDLKKKKIAKIINYHNSAITAIAFQKNTGNIFSGTRNGKIAFWREKSYVLICELENFHQGPIWSLQCSKNGKFLASGSQDKSLKIWKIEKFFIYNSKLDLNFEKNKKSTILSSVLKKKKIFNHKNFFLENKFCNIEIIQENFTVFNFFLNRKQTYVKNILNSKHSKKIFLKIHEILKKNQIDSLIDSWLIIEKINWIFKFYNFKEAPNILYEIEKEKKKILRTFEEKISFNLKVFNFLTKIFIKRKSDLPDSN
jgi:U3 small nucleolar RNA-associated protein 12